MSFNVMCRTQPLRAGLGCCGTKTVCIPSIKVCFYCLGVAASERGDFKTARDYFELRLKELKVTGNKDLEGVTKMHIGVVYLSLADIKKAIEFLEHGLSIAKEVRNKPLEGDVYHFLGLHIKISGFSKMQLNTFKRIYVLPKQAFRGIRKCKPWSSLPLSWRSRKSIRLLSAGS